MLSRQLQRLVNCLEMRDSTLLWPQERYCSHTSRHFQWSNWKTFSDVWRHPPTCFCKCWKVLLKSGKLLCHMSEANHYRLEDQKETPLTLQHSSSQLHRAMLTEVKMSPFRWALMFGKGRPWSKVCGTSTPLVVVADRVLHLDWRVQKKQALHKQG